MDIFAPPVIAAIIGAVVALATIVVRDVFIERERHIREQRKQLVERRLANAYAPVEYWLAVLSDVDASEAMKVEGREEIRKILRAHGYLLEPHHAADLHAVTAYPVSAEDIARINLRFGRDFEELASQFYTLQYSERRTRSDELRMREDV